MATEVEKLEVVVGGRIDGLEKELKKATKILGKFGTSVSSVDKKTGGLTKSLGLSKVAVLATAAAVVAATTKIIVSSTKLAIATVESENLVAVTFGELTGKVTEWSNELESALGLNAYTLRKNAGVFYNIAKSMGVAEDNAYNLSTGVVSLANDMASFYDIKTEDAINKLRSGLTGISLPLKQLGIVVDETTIKQTAYRLGIAETNTELSNGQKVMARYMTILEQTGNAQGDLARTINTPANQLRILQSQFEGLKISIGNIFIPVLNAVLPYMNAFVAVVKEAVVGLATLFGMTGLASNITDMGSSVSDVGVNLDDTTASAEKLKKTLAGFDEMTVLQRPEAGAGTGIAGAGGMGAFEIPEYDLGMEGLKSKTDEIIEKFRQVGESIKEFFAPVTKMWKEWVEPAFEGLKLVIADIFGKTDEGIAFGDVLKEIGRIIAFVVVGAIGGLIYIITGVITISKWLFRQITKSFNSFVNVIANVIVWFRKLKSNVTKVWNSMKERIDSVRLQIIGLWGIVKKVFSIIASFIWVKISRVIDRVKRKIQELKDAFSGFSYRIVIAIKTPINRMIDTINNFLRPLRNIKIPVIAPHGLKVPYIPRLARGAVVNGSTLAEIGEAGKEVVLPLENNTEWMDDLAKKMGGKEGVINLRVDVGGEKLYEKAIKYIKDKSLVTNTNLLGL